MKFIILIAICPVLFSCKKNEKNIFLTGKVVDNCSGSALEGQTLYLYKDYQPGIAGTNILEQEEKLLEKTTTDENGVFVFRGKGYTDRETKNISYGSIRSLDGVVLAQGVLGKGKGAEGEHDSNQNVGNLYVNGIEGLLLLNVSKKSTIGGTVYDSVNVSCIYCESQTSSTLNGNWFYVEVPIQLNSVKSFNFSTDSDGNSIILGGYSFSLNVGLYQNGFIQEDISVNYSYSDCFYGKEEYIEY